jgi:hypothetical protein
MLSWITKSKHERRAADRAALGGAMLLADHLDAALALAEDLLGLGVDPVALRPGTPMRVIQTQTDAFATALDRIRALELAMIARLLQARKRALELQDYDANFKPVIRLFVGATALLEDRVEGFGDESREAFTDGHVATAYLRSRGLIGPDTPGPAAGQRLAIGEDFAVAGAVPLGMLMDEIATFLDKLDLMFSLYDPDAAGDALSASAGRRDGPSAH